MDTNQQSAQLYVGNLSWGVGSKELREAFEKFGKVTDATLIQTVKTKRSKGYGFVTFEKFEDAKKAIEALNGKDLDGRTVSVTFAKDRTKEPPNLRDDRVHIANLPIDYSNEDLEKLLSEFGKCDDCNVLDDGGVKCFGYATFVNADDAKKAVESLNGTKLGDKALEVIFARKRRKRKQRKKKSSSSATTELKEVVPNQLYIRKLPRDVTEESVSKLFGTFGEIEKISLMTRKGYGFVTFKSADDAAKALAGLSDAKLGGSTLQVQQAREPEKNSTKSEDEDTKKVEQTNEGEETESKSNVLWVGGLPSDVQMDDVKSVFEKKGFTVSKCKPGHKRRGHFFCYITLDTHENAKKAAISMDGTEWKDSDEESKISVEIRKMKRKKKKTKSKKKQKPKKTERVVEYFDNELFVKGLPDGTTKESLAEIFKKFGSSIHETKVSESRAKKMIGFVTFKEASVAAEALKALNGQNVSGETLEIQYARAPPSSSSD